MSIDDLISKFPNGQERFNNDPIFHNIIYSLANGEDPLKIIDNLIKANNEILDKLRTQLLK